jgi:hypothetical protein
LSTWQRPQVHVVNEPYLVMMSDLVERLGWQPGLSGCHKNSPDGSVTQILFLILEQGEAPTPQKPVLVAFLQHSNSDFFSNFAMCVAWC